ncbi:MAG: alpha/beta fold hydrolase [Actinomycetota bacterium]
MATVKFIESADGTPIAYRVTGAGEPMVMVHGSGTWSADWLFVLPLLRDHFTVVTMDRRGRPCSGDARDYAIEREAEDVLAVLDAVDADLLVGHSYGAMCSILAAKQTERLRRLVVYEPPIGVTQRGFGALQELIAAGEHEAAIEGFLRSIGTSDEQFKAIRSSPAWPDLVRTAPALSRELRACVDWQHPPGPIHVPTLFLMGEKTQSPVYLDGLDDLQAAFPGAQRDLIPGQMHVAHVFAARVFAELVTAFFNEPSH